MSKYLVILAWPVGITIVLGIAFLLVRSQPRPTLTTPGPVPSGGSPGPGSVASAARMLGLIALGTLAVYGVMALLGLLVVHHGLAVDRPVNDWMTGHRVHAWAAAMNRLTKIGNTWTCWGAAVSAAVCLAVSWRAQRWLPPAVLGALIVVDHYTTLALRHTFHRLGPPDSPLGTYPSGGCDRVIVFYGLIAYLLWREFSGQRRAAIWAAAAVAALGFNEAYSRVYLTLHWFTDALSGLLYGGLLLAVFIAAVRVVAGPAPAAARAGRDTARAVRAPATQEAAP